VLTFDVTPNGQVSDAHVTSSDIPDAEFTNGVLNIIRQTEFGPKDSVPTRVRDFATEFGPA
jgi:outer membrane biosynthesis protein TonB